MTTPSSIGGPAIVKIFPALITTTLGPPACEPDSGSRLAYPAYPAASNSGLSRSNRPGINQLTAIDKAIARTTSARTTPVNPATRRLVPFKKIRTLSFRLSPVLPSFRAALRPGRWSSFLIQPSPPIGVAIFMTSVFIIASSTSKSSRLVF